MVRRLPSLNALKAFEAAARHKSFTRASEELCVTSGAISHQVKALEGELGLQLFKREPRRLVITEAGSAYLITIRDALDRIAEGTEQLLRRQSSGVLTVSVSPNFASKWLVHRLGRFAEQFPDIDLRVSATLHHVDFALEDIEIAIRHRESPEPGLEFTRLYTEKLFPVCSPDLVRGKNALRKPDDLVHHTLLHLDNRQDWSKWLDLAGVSDAELQRGPVLNQASMVIDAAVDGQGVALARTGLAAHDLINGRLVRPFEFALPVSYAYWIVCSAATANLPKIATFRDWIMAEAEAESEDAG